MNKYLIYYSSKKTPGPIGYFIIKLYKEDDQGFEGFRFDKYSLTFNDCAYIGVNRKHKHCIIETDSDTTAILIFETMINELEFTEDIHYV